VESNNVEKAECSWSGVEQQTAKWIYMYDVVNTRYGGRTYIY
jgi:hypothetical protein